MSDIKEKWNVGKFPSTVVSNKKQRNELFPTPPNPIESKDEEIEYYGGYLVCESIGNNQSANLIAIAPELLEVLKGLVSDVSGLLGDYGIEWQQAGYYTEAKELIKKATE